MQARLQAQQEKIKQLKAEVDAKTAAHSAAEQKAEQGKAWMATAREAFA